MYTLQLIPSNLRPEELHYQIGDSLDQLNSAYSSVFSQILLRVHAIRLVLTQLTERLNSCQSKTDNLKKRHNAITVKHARKFHGADRTVNYRCALRVQTTSEHNFLTASLESTVELGSKLVQFEQQILLKKLYVSKFCDREIARINRRMRRSTFQAGTFGESASSNQSAVEPFPNDLRSVSSLVLFNSRNLPYQRPISSGRHVGDAEAKTRSNRTSSRATNELTTDIGMGLRSEKPEVSVEPRLYVSESRYAPAMQLPDALPDLVAIADDEEFDLESLSLPDLGLLKRDSPKQQ